MCRQYRYSCVYMEFERYSALSMITKFNNEIPIFFVTYNNCVQIFFNSDDKHNKKLTDFKISATVLDPIEHRLMEFFYNIITNANIIAKIFLVHHQIAD